MSTTTTPIFHPRTPKQLILFSSGHTTPGWITHIASLLSPAGANAALQNSRNDRTLCYLLSEPNLLQLCSSFNRELPSQIWTAEDEERHSDERFGADNLERECEVENMLAELERRGVDLKGIDERSTWSLRAVEVNGPFEIRVDADGHESVVEVPDRRHVMM